MVRSLIKLILALIALLIAAFAAAGILIPAEQTFSQETEINAPVETVWQVLNDREKYPEWQEKISTVEIRDANTWTEISKDAGPIEFEFVRKEKPKVIELKYSTPSGVSGEWKGELTFAGEGKTRVKTFDKLVVKSWIAKVFMSMFFDLEEFAKGWNQSLRKRAESIGPQPDDSRN